MRGGGRKSHGFARRGTIWDKNEEGGVVSVCVCVCMCVCVCVCVRVRLQLMRAGTMQSRPRRVGLAIEQSRGEEGGDGREREDFNQSKSR